MSPEPFDSRAKAPPAKRWEKGCVWGREWGATRESLGEFEKAVETPVCGSYSHSICRSLKLPLLFLELDRNTVPVFYFLSKLRFFLILEIGGHVNCNLAKVPSHAVMTSKGNANKANYVSVLLEASKQYGNDSGSFALFDSANYGDKKDLLFKDSTKELKDVSDKTYGEFLGKDYMEVIKGLNECLAVDGGKDSLKPYFLASVGLAFVALVLSGTAE